MEKTFGLGAAPSQPEHFDFADKMASEIVVSNFNHTEIIEIVHRIIERVSDDLVNQREELQGRVNVLSEAIDRLLK